MSFYFAGSAQFVTVSMLTGGSPILSIVLATFLVNARMILMGMTIAPLKPNLSVKSLVGNLTDG